ncbi:MAG: hypothetical protein ACP5O4_03850 [bacterium]
MLIRKKNSIKGSLILTNTTLNKNSVKIIFFILLLLDIIFFGLLHTQYYFILIYDIQRN